MKDKIYGNVAFTAVYPEKRGKCSASKKISLWQNKLCVKFIAQSSHGESCGDVLSQGKVEPRPKKVFSGLIPRDREHSPRSEMFGITLNYEQIMSRRRTDSLI